MDTHYTAVATANGRDGRAVSSDGRPDLKLAPGLYDLTVENGDGKLGTLGKAMLIVGRPHITEIKPMEICTAQFDNMMQIVGTGFLRVSGTLPSIKVGDKVFAPLAADGCTAAPRSGIDLRTKLSFTIPKDALPPGLYDVVVTNPAPAGCMTT